MSLVSWDESCELRRVLWAEMSLVSWDESCELRRILWAETSLVSWDESCELSLANRSNSAVRCSAGTEVDDPRFESTPALLSLQELWFNSQRPKHPSIEIEKSIKLGVGVLTRVRGARACCLYFPMRGPLGLWGWKWKFVSFFSLFFSSIHAFVLMGLRRPAGSLWVKDIVSGLSFHPPPLPVQLMKY